MDNLYALQRMTDAKLAEARAASARAHLAASLAAERRASRRPLGLALAGAVHWLARHVAAARGRRQLRPRAS